MNRIWLILNALSLDITLGTLGVGFLAVTTTQSAVPPIWWGILPCAAWVIYSLDHMADAARSHQVSQFRHQFYQTYKTPLTVATALVGMATIIAAIWGLSQPALLIGAILGTLCCIHIFLTKFDWYGATKEISVAILYGIGIWSIPLVYTPALKWTMAIPLLSIIISVYTSLLTYAYFECDVDAKSDSISIAQTFSKYSVGKLGILVWAGHCTALIWISFYASFPIPILVCFTLIGILSGLPFLFPEMFETHHRYRLFGELLFYLPIPILLT